MASISSSAIRHVRYDSGKRELHVVFRDSGDYTYFDVPAEKYQALRHAESPGKYLNQQIKGRYRCARRGAPKRRIWLDEARWPQSGTTA